jgi:hypothetical protein
MDQDYRVPATVGHTGTAANQLAAQRFRHGPSPLLAGEQAKLIPQSRSF